MYNYEEYKIGGKLAVQGDEHGYVRLLEIMGSDEGIVDAARISYDRRGRSEDRALIRYLLRNGHTSPFEMAEMKFEIKMPIFVARQWIRHRTASLNEMSARYTELPAEMFVPESEAIAAQSTDNKQGRADESLGNALLPDAINHSNLESYAVYKTLLGEGVTRELARGVLPLNTYTKMIWKMDLHNLMHFLRLRLHPHAQREITHYAEQIERLVALKFPLTYEAFVDYQRDAYTCSRMEVDLLRALLRDANCDLGEAGFSQRELKEFKEKFFDVE